MIALLWTVWNDWTFTELPQLNREILSGASLEALIGAFHRNVLDKLPDRKSVV